MVPEPQTVSATTLPAKPVSVTPLIWFSVLLFALYATTIIPMVKEWFVEEDMGHGIFVPFVSGYIIWTRREQILSQKIQGSWWGLIPLVWGFVQLFFGTVGADFFISRTALLFSIVGMIWTLAGLAVLREMIFALALLVFMIRIPQFIYGSITLPLQILASQLGAGALNVIGIPVLREGNVLHLPSQDLSVVEACSGIRSLLSLTFLSLAYGYFFEKSTRVRAFLCIVAVPIAIVANAFRITITGILTEYNKDLAEGVYHAFEGWLIFMVALLALVATHRFINYFSAGIRRARSAPQSDVPAA